MKVHPSLLRAWGGCCNSLFKVCSPFYINNRSRQVSCSNFLKETVSKHKPSAKSERSLTIEIYCKVLEYAFIEVKKSGFSRVLLINCKVSAIVGDSSRMPRPTWAATCAPTWPSTASRSTTTRPITWFFNLAYSLIDDSMRKRHTSRPSKKLNSCRVLPLLS
jgi:hypothetical protein